MSEKQEPITIDNINKVLRFLPVFEKEDYEFGQYTLTEFESGSSPFPFYDYRQTVIEFEQTLYEEGFIIDFDWPKWQDEAKRLHCDREALEKADLETLQKLLTTHTRKDRFCEGHLAAMLREGHVAAILNRLKEIREEMTD